jgi:cyclin T
MLQTLGFDIAIEHPHTFVVKTCELVKATKDLAQTCYFMATNSLHLTTLCLQQRPTVVACVCIYLACQWSDYDVPRSREGREWFNYVDPHLTLDTLKQLTNYFISILDQCPSRLKMKIMQGGGKGSGSDNVSNASPSHVTHSSQSSHSSTPPPTRVSWIISKNCNVLMLTLSLSTAL